MEKQDVLVRLEKHYRLGEVEELCGIRKSTIYSLMKAGDFPSPVKLSLRCVAWRESDLLAWQAARQNRCVQGV